VVCRNQLCGKPHENVRGKCPSCGSDSQGHADEKHAVKPRDLANNYCAHGIFRLEPCAKCERSAEECEDYRRHFMTIIRDWLIKTRGVARREAWEQAKEYLPALDAN
jgi:hypothetical protein